MKFTPGFALAVNLMLTLLGLTTCTALAVSLIRDPTLLLTGFTFLWFPSE